MVSVKENKVVNVLGLLIKCPLDVPLDNCPAIKYRKLPFDEKFKLVRNLKEEDLDEIISHHQECIKLRERNMFGPS